MIGRLLVDDEEVPERFEVRSFIDEFDEAELREWLEFDPYDVAVRLFEDLLMLFNCSGWPRTIVTFRSMWVEPSLAVVRIDDDTCGVSLIVVET